jgi:uncharacterized membrane protein
MITFFLKNWILWNIILAILPFGLWQLYLFFKAKKPQLLRWSSLVLTILFIPNSIYLTTDIIHIFDSVPDDFYWYGGLPSKLWSFMSTGVLVTNQLYNFTMVFLFILGVILFYLQSKLVFDEFKLNLKWQLSYFAVMAYAVFLGRFVRLNSWDVFVSPMSFINQLNPGLEGLIFVIGFTVFEVVGFFGFGKTASSIAVVLSKAKDLRV